MTRLRRAVPAVLVATATVWAGLGLFGVAEAGDPNGPLELTAEFPRAIGLYAGDQVRVLGLPAGEVTEVEPAIDHVEVTMRLDDVALAPDAVAALRLRSLIGERFVELGPVWSGKGPKLGSGDVIPRDRTIVPAEISEVLDEATRLADGLDRDAASALLRELSEAFGGRHDAVAALTAELGEVGRVLEGRAAEIDRGLAQLDRIVGTLAARDDAVVKIMQGSAAVTDALLAQEGALDASITGLDAMLAELGTFTGDQKERLVALVEVLDRVGQVLKAHEADFGRVVEELPYFSYGYERAIQEDDGRWYVVNHPMGLLFLPTGPALNSRGGPGTDADDDGRVAPRIEHGPDSPLQAMPSEIDATGATGPGPLLPNMTLGEEGQSITIDDGRNTEADE